MIQYLKTLGLVTLSVFAPIKSVLLAAFVVSAIDLVTGLIASKKQQKAITSSGLKRTIAKIVLYEVAILASFVAEKYLLGDIIPACKIVGGFIGATELKSVLENLDIINGSSVFTSLVTRLAQHQVDKIDR